ncbi:hypothetical protein P170DRAFT_440155 [Aspergillus steynii IBT 23096]|uniref:Uncharacterized protein n=1 Tax=Aspergillus steynii IBT 23096 TaxID=1392250 RepID=A0A2I2FWH4_9EURO|nr:uncharacterized protein P170DRAFT_440155 [Aspergillus steynii IBT 23096]PLB44974.1 hypothetical protein P170DRAFT_440155 [Aspergillus steynii IBT 23096]
MFHCSQSTHLQSSLQQPDRSPEACVEGTDQQTHLQSSPQQPDRSPEGCHERQRKERKKRESLCQTKPTRQQQQGLNQLSQLHGRRKNLV